MAPELPLGLPLAVWIGAGAVVGILLAAVVYIVVCLFLKKCVAVQHKCQGKWSA